MHLKSFSVDHYKSLNRVTVNVTNSPLVFVGENASGKSNIIDALRFIRDAVRDGLEHAISMRGGIDVLRQYAPTRPYKIGFCLEFEQSFANQSYPAHYEFKLSSVGSGNYCIDHEFASWYEDDSWFFHDEETDEGNEKVKVDLHTFNRDAKGKVKVDDGEFTYPSDELFLGSRNSHYGRIGLPIAQFLAQIKFFSLYPNILRNQSRPETDRFLKEGGENWASVLKSMKKTERGKRNLNRIIEMMRLVLPSLVDVQVKAIGGYLVPQFLVRDTPNGKGHFFDPIQLSDGTLRVFGILLAIYQVQQSAIVAIEEPEQTVNPGVLAMLADAFNEVARSSQLIVTSHSPNLVDYFDPEGIRVVAMRRGETICTVVKASQLESVKYKLSTLSELMMLDGLQPELEG